MNIEELKRLAEAANKGFSGLPWQVIMERNNHGSTHYRVRGHCEASIAVEPDQYWEEDYDPPTDEYGYFQPDDRMDCDLVRVDIARHIAAANPAAVLELIRQRDELLAALKVFADKYNSAPDGDLGIGLVNGDFFRAIDAIARAEAT